MTPQTLSELFEIDPAEIDWTKSIYAINRSLNLAPWMPPVVSVWKLKDRRPDSENPQHWEHVLSLLNQLYTEHERRNGNET